MQSSRGRGSLGIYKICLVHLRVAGAKDGGFDERSVLLRVLEAKDGAVVDIDEVGDEGGVVGEEDLLVRIHGGDDDIKAGVQGVGGRGEVQVREFQGRDDEGGVVGAIGVPIVWSIRSLRETSKIDRKAGRNLAKLTLFMQFYIIVTGYLYFTHIVVFALKTIATYKYQWVSNLTEEVASLAFYVVMFYMFRHVEKNGYFVLDEKEEEVVEIAVRDEEFEL
ncbi:hypothetical protein JHK82_028031 [Glycine max]|nr:hypothetical protein JHK87_027942 [Glycine soja]KAG5127196.1 hypothetical protein JHK82_028031 [Glycine max]